MKKNISIIIPTLNEEKFIGETIRFLRRHGNAQLFEIIVVDGGSSDNTINFAKNEGAVVLSSPQKGRALQMNLGAQHSQQEILYFMHADTIPPETYIADIINALSNGVKMGCFRYKFDSPRLILRFNAFFTRFSFLFCQGGDKTFFISRDIFFEMGGYDSEHIIMEEYDFLRRAKRSGYELAVLPCTCTVSARKYENNSWIRVQIANLVVYNLWVWSMAKPQKLQFLYKYLLGGSAR